MNKLESFLYQHRILKLSENKLEKWYREEQLEKLFFAAENGMFNIRLKCVKLLSNRISKSEVKTLLTSMISDEVEIVSEAAIKSLEPSVTPELAELIERIRKERKTKKRKEKHMKSHLANIQFGDSGKTRPSERLMNTLRDQQRTNEPPYGF